MKKEYSYRLLFFLALVILSHCSIAQATKETISIDFGPDNQISAAPWNNLTNVIAGSGVVNLVNDYNEPTGFSIAVKNPFNSWNLNGTTADDTLGIPYSASRESFYGNTVSFNNQTVPSASLIVSNLDVTKAYGFSFFASRAGVSDNRETLYIVNGMTIGSVALNASNNVSRVVRVNNIMPKADGTITIEVKPGPNNNNSNGFFYLSALKISYLVERGPKSLTLIAPNGGGELKAGKDAAIAWERNGVTSVDIDYSLNNGVSWQSVATDVPATTKMYKWRVPAASTENALVRVSDSADPSVKDVSDQTFRIFQGTNGKEFTIVVLGSSTAAGTGPSSRDSAWVWRYTNYLSHKRSEFNVINLAVGGYSTANIIPEGNQDHNITKALSLNPDAIIINLPSNDAAGGRSVQDQLSNYNKISEKVTKANIPLWVTTPQPRNFSQDKVQIQLDMIEATYAKFGEVFTVDFWTGFNAPDNTMKPIYNSGDGVHMNDAAHKVMFDRIVGENISGYLESIPLGVANDLTGKVRVFPNPTIGSISLETSNGYRIEKVELMSLTGKRVFEKTGNGRLEVANLPKGAYIMHIYTNKGRFHSRLVVQ